MAQLQCGQVSSNVQLTDALSLKGHSEQKLLSLQAWQTISSLEHLVAKLTIDDKALVIGIFMAQAIRLTIADSLCENCGVYAIGPPMNTYWKHFLHL